MTELEPTGYPEHLAGEPAPPPEAIAPRLFDMALRAHERTQPAGDLDDVDELYAAAAVRSARSLDALLAEADAAAPGRKKGSDGGIGDARHRAQGRATDHNPWLIVAGVGVFRARDFTNDPQLRLHDAFERARALAAAGKLPQLLNGGYLILNRRITAPDFSGWRAYTGDNPHVAHGHASVSLNPAQFDLPAPWGIFVAPPAPAPSRPPAPAPARPGSGWTGPDLVGVGLELRGLEGNNGARVQAWQRWFAANYPAYRHRHGALVADGYWGPVTTAWNREFAHRVGIVDADGRNIGPRLAAAYRRAGLFRRLSAAQARAASHVARGIRR